MKVDDYSYSIGQAQCVMWYHETQYGPWRTGYHVSKLGVVFITVDTDGCELRVPYNGRMYRRRITGDRYMIKSPARIAAMFLKEILNKSN